MPDTNFELTPPAREVDGLHAVPIGHLMLPVHNPTLELRRPPGLPNLQASIIFPPAPTPIDDGRDAPPSLDRAGALHGDATGTAGTTDAPPNFEGGKESRFGQGARARVEIASNSGFPLLSLAYELVQLDANKRPVGGIAVMVVVKA